LDTLASLDGLQLRALREAILDAFEPDEFGQLLSDRLNQRLHNLVPTTVGYETQVFQLLNKFRARGLLDQLVKAVEVERPKNPHVVRLRVTLGLLNPVGPSGSSEPERLERLIREASPFIDFSRWISELVALQGRVCRVEGQAFGTGFLVSPNFVLTNHHVVAEEIRNTPLARDLLCRFDYLSTGTLGVQEGRVARPSTEWHVASSPPTPDGLDYALLQLSEPVGEDQVAEGRKRGFVQILSAPTRLSTGAIVEIVQHPKGGPLAMSVGTVTGYCEDDRRMRYAANTERGSSGSPVLGADLTVVGLHHSGDPDLQRDALYNEGVPISSIVQHLGSNARVPRFWQ
jgi:hypothetical protein